MMKQIKQKAGLIIGILCAVLLGTAAAGNLFVGSVTEQAVAAAGNPEMEPAEWEAQYTEEQMQQAAETLAMERGSKEKEQENATRNLDNRLAALRMERDQSWQKLLSGMDVLQTAEKEEWKNRYTTLQFKEQRLELLLKAKGVRHCLAVLEEHQANIIVSETELREQYEKLYDLVQRNSDYAAEQIILIPLKAE